MAKKKSIKKKKKGKKSNIIPQLKQLFLGIVLLFMIVGTGAYFLFTQVPFHEPPAPGPKKEIRVNGPLKKKTIPKEVRVKHIRSSSVVTKKHTKIPVYEIEEDLIIPVPKTDISHKKEKKSKPEISIIIDDLGYDLKQAEKFINLKVPLTFSILPFSAKNKKIANAVHKNGFEVMLHLPMEPMEYPDINPGEGVLLTSMGPDTLINQLKKNIDDVPYIKGINNHMGSKFTTISTKMYQVFTIMKQKELYFVDSYTTVNSLCMPSARLLKIPYARRDVFIDHEKNKSFIKNQLHQLIKTAKKDGSAIGIGHPYDLTYSVLKNMLPEIQKHAVLVPASKLVKEL